MGLEIDIRLPVALFSKKHFLYAGQYPRMFLCGVLSDVFGNQMYLYPLLVSEVSSNNRINDRLFCFTFPYTDRHGDLVLFVTQPCWLSSTNERRDIFEFLLTNLENLARHISSKFIEIEFHSEMNSEVAYPTSLTHFSYDQNDPYTLLDDLSLLQQHGFGEEDTIFCYELGLNDFEERAVDSLSQVCGDYTAINADVDQFQRLREKAHVFPIKEYAPSDAGSFVTCHNNLPILTSTVSIAYRGDNFAGFLQWFPNLLEVTKTYPTPCPLLFPYILDGYPFKCGKILRWGLYAEDEALLAALLLHTLQSMRSKGLNKCQVAYVDRNQSFIRGFLEHHGFRRIHKTLLLREEV